jgi:hypothetical protein
VVVDDEPEELPELVDPVVVPVDVPVDVDGEVDAARHRGGRPRISGKLVHPESRGVSPVASGG